MSKNQINTILLTSLITSLISYLIFSYVFYRPQTSTPPKSDDSQTKVTLPSSENNIVDIVEKSNPAVVSIVISKDVPVIEQYYEDVSPFGGNLFDGFFGESFGFKVPQYRQNGTEKKEVGGGSGFFVSNNGLVVTNKHVVSDETAEYTVFSGTGEKYQAKVLAKDAVLDIAILKVEAKNLPFLEFGDSEEIKPGQTVIAIGNALGEFRNSVSVGVVSGLSRSIIAGDLSGRSEALDGVIQTDAAINPGNSGGPLLDTQGKVIGVNVAVERGAENIGFALSGNSVKNIVDSVKEHGEIIRPYLGVRFIPITQKLMEINHLTVNYGALIKKGETSEELAVMPGSPADKAGLVENDIILEVDGTKLETNKSLTSVIREKQVGQTIKLKILHQGNEKEVFVVLDRAPNSK